MASRIPLAGRRIVVTGASGGIGAASVRRFAAGGASLALIARDRAALDEVAGRARDAGAKHVEVLPADVGDRDETQDVVERAAVALGGIDVLVANAGASHFGAFRDTSPEDFDRTFAVVFGGVVAATRAALPHLKRAQHGRVVATASVLSRSPVPGLSAYVAAKHGVRGFLGSLRVELGAAGSPVRVAMVHPGPVDTGFWKTMPSSTGREPPLPPLSYSPEAVARAIAHCATAATPPAELTVGALMTVLYGASTALGRPLGERFTGVLWQTGSAQAGPPAPPPERASLQAPVERSDPDRGRHGGRPSLRTLLLRP